VPSTLPIVVSESRPAFPGADPSLVVSTEERWGPRLQRLRQVFHDDERWVAAFSGGVDSAVVLRVAIEERGDDVLALTAASDTLPETERLDCERIAASMGARHHFVTTFEMNVPGFFTNPTNRCYFCKTELYSVAREEARRLGYGRIADGVNLDDLGDHRPGLLAAREHTVVHPLIEAGMT